MTPIDRPFDFRGATALVVGGASGLGRAMAESLAQHGASVCIAARTEEKARTIAAEISARAGARCENCAADLAAEESVQALGATVDRLFGGRLNIAVNSAGVNVRNRIEAISLDEWSAIQRVNSTGAFLFAREMYPRLKAAGWGRLIHVASIFGSRSLRRPHQLRVEQGCAAAADADAGDRVGGGQHHGQRDLARADPDRDDQAGRRRPGALPRVLRAYPARPVRRAARGRDGVPVPRVAGVRRS